MSAFYPAPRGERARRRGITLLEVIIILALAALVVAVLLPSLGTGDRRGGIRLVCAANLKGIGTSMKLYATDNLEAWAMPAFDESAVGTIRYTVAPGSGAGTAASPGRAQLSVGGPGGAVELSTTRAYWMLVRSGEVTVKQFICPYSGDEPDETENLDLYYDFTGLSNISYGYQVPFGPTTTRPREGADSRMPLAADKGPYVDASVGLPGAGLTLSSEAKAWRPFNSRNHGGEGQNVLYADGHVTFERRPVIGVDGDNIYTVALDNLTEASRVIGESPWRRSAHPFQPVDAEGVLLSSTDSVIFP
jgi:prepilin-type processing-associated H-X9-DG protein